MRIGMPATFCCWNPWSAAVPDCTRRAKLRIARRAECPPHPWSTAAPGFLCRAVACLLTLLMGLDAVAQDRRPARRAQSRPATTQSSQATTTSTSTSASTSTSTASAAAEKKKDRYLAVINGRVLTMAGATYARGTVLAKNARIIAIGDEVRLPAECEVIDAAGMWVYPGLVAVRSSGLFGGPPVQDTTDVYSLNQRIAVAGGITTTVAGDDAVKLTYGSTQDMTIRKGLYVNLTYSRRSPLDRAKLRADLERVRGYLRDLSQFEMDKQRDPDAKEPDKEWIKGDYQNYLKLLRGEATAAASADLRQDLIDLAELARQFGFKLVIRGGYEGWTVADRLGRAGVSLVVTPRTRVLPDERLLRASGSTIENAAILHRSGVPIALIPANTSITTWGVAGRDLLHMNLEAAFAVRGGLSNEDATRAITIDAARILGVADRVGSLEIGKDMDLIVCDGDILSYMTQVHRTIVNGRVVYDKLKDTFYSYIRPEGRPEPVEFEDHWPRRLEWPAQTPATAPASAPTPGSAPAAPPASATAAPARS